MKGLLQRGLDLDKSLLISGWSKSELQGPGAQEAGTGHVCREPRPFQTLPVRYFACTGDFRKWWEKKTEARNRAQGGTGSMKRNKGL